jgi:hypothetical protein
MPRWSAERRDVPIARDVKTPRKRLACLTSTQGCRHGTLRFSVLHSPSFARKSKKRGEKGTQRYGGAGAAKHRAGGAAAARRSPLARLGRKAGGLDY